MTSRDFRRQALADFRLGWRTTPEDLAIAALVVMPFTAALAIFVSQLSGLPSLWIMILFVVAQVLATSWNAGWRARASDTHEG